MPDILTYGFFGVLAVAEFALCRYHSKHPKR